VESLKLHVQVGYGECSRCHAGAHVRTCMRCSGIFCERCLAVHMGSHDPGGLGSAPPPPKPKEDVMELNQRHSFAPTAALILAVVAIGVAGYREVSIAEREGHRSEQIAGLQDTVKELKARMAVLEGKADHNTALLERLVEQGQARR
jgi:hypothetical protein